jgi:uncharacterized protein (DUF1800 family)
MMKELFLPFFLLLTGFQLFSQEMDYIGAGNDSGITVMTSSAMHQAGWNHAAEGENTVSGNGLEGKLIPASRFLAQATLGADLYTIERVAEMGFEAWIEEQFRVAPSSYYETLKELYQEIFDDYIANGGDPNDFRCRPNWARSNYAWWQMIMTSEDLLLQRIALALSEIMVISKENSDLRDYGFAISSYYDIFLRNGFGNFRDILYEVSLHPAMGNYLSHLNNPKSNTEENYFPDENYAREVMQLFSIGLYELNTDGSWKTDSEGKPIPTYDNEDIKGLAKVFTGLGAGGISECSDSFAPAFGLRISRIDMTQPMAMYEDWHEEGEKQIVGDFVIPAGQTGMQDIEMAIDHLFNHPNVGPFIAQLLIKKLIKSNPSADYIERVAEAFNGKETGIRGDMKATIRAILLDPEARECDAMMDPFNGKMREPILRFTHFARLIDKFTPYGRYWNRGDDFLASTGQIPMHSPSVFNFFLPDYQPGGEIAENDLVAPEFQLLNTQSSLNYINEVDDWVIDELLFYHYESGETWEQRVYIDLYQMMEKARDMEVLLNHLDLLLTHGQMTERTRGLLTRRLTEEFSTGGVSMLESRAKMALYFLLFSPDYIIMK